MLLLFYLLAFPMPANSTILQPIFLASGICPVCPPTIITSTFCGDLNVAHTEDDLANPKPNIGKHGFTNEERAGFDAFIKIVNFVAVLKIKPPLV